MADYETSQRKRNIAVGAFVLIGLAAFVWMVYLFGEMPIIAARWRAYEVDVRFEEAPGIQENTPVYFAGYPVGRVTRIKQPTIMQHLETDKWMHMTQVTIAIEDKFDQIPEDVRVRLMQRGFGSSFIRMDAEPFDVREPPGPFLRAGSLVQGQTGMTSEFFPEETQKKLEELVGSMIALINNANDIIGDEATKANILQTVENMTDVTAQARLTLQAFEDFADKGTGTLELADEEIQKLVAAVVNTAEELSSASAQLRVLLNKAHEGDGTLARILNDPKLYEQLLEDARQVEFLMQDIRAFIQEVTETGVPLRLR